MRLCADLKNRLSLTSLNNLQDDGKIIFRFRRQYLNLLLNSRRSSSLFRHSWWMISYCCCCTIGKIETIWNLSWVSNFVSKWTLMCLLPGRRQALASERRTHIHDWTSSVTEIVVLKLRTCYGTYQKQIEKFHRTTDWQWHRHDASNLSTDEQTTGRWTKTTKGRPWRIKMADDLMILPTYRRFSFSRM